MKNFFATTIVTLLVVMLLLAGCGGSPQAVPTPTSPPATSTPVPATPAPLTPTPAPTATPTPELNLESVTLEFQSPVASIEDANRVLDFLLDKEGVKDGLASESTFSIHYDPEVITLEEIRSYVEGQGIPLK